MSLGTREIGRQGAGYSHIFKTEQITPAQCQKQFRRLAAAGISSGGQSVRCPRTPLSRYWGRLCVIAMDYRMVIWDCTSTVISPDR